MTYEEKLKDIQEHPERHKHSFDGLTRCCSENGAINLGLMDAHSRYASHGTNGGVRCDVSEGPCSCGGWH